MIDKTRQEQNDRLAEELIAAIFGSDGEAIQVLKTSDPGYWKGIGAPISRETILSVVIAMLNGSYSQSVAEKIIRTFRITHPAAFEQAQMLAHIISWQNRQEVTA